MAIDRTAAMLKARLTARDMNDGDFLITGQTGRLLIHELTGYETDAGSYCAFHGEIVSVKPKVSGGAVQAVGTKIRSVFTCNGKYAQIGWERVYKMICALFDLELQGPSEVYVQHCAMVFGALGETSKATKEEQADPFFAARGMLIDFSTSINAKSAEKRKAQGKEAIVQETWTHVSDKQGNSLEEIVERAKKLPPLSL